MLQSGKHRALGRRTLLAGTSLLPGLLPFGAARAQVRPPGPGVALVIGNSKYKWEAQLPNVRRDAPDIARCFQALGLKTDLVQDATRDQMLAAIERFRGVADNSEFAAFYFAGHGASWDKDTYLVPVDADLGTPEAVRTMPRLTGVFDATKGAHHRLMVLDACRNNPADGWRQKAAERSSFVAVADRPVVGRYESTTLVLYSTAPGRVALDGPAGENSPFAAAFLRQFEAPTVDLGSVPEALRRDLLIATEGGQVLWDQTTFTGRYVMKSSARRTTGGANRPGPKLDPSSVMEMPQAYVFAREKKLPLPVGLVAARPPGSTKIGSFKFTMKAVVGSTTRGGSSLESGILVVLTAPEGGSAQVILSTRLWDHHGTRGAFWHFMPARSSSDRIELTTSDNTRLTFVWRDANSGTLSAFASGTIAADSRSTFERLDG